MKKSKEKSAMSAYARGASALVLAALFLCGAAWGVAELEARRESFSAQQYIKARNLDKAGQASRRAVRLDPQSGYAAFFRGRYFNLAGRQEKALEWLRRSLRTIGHPGASLRLIAAIHFALNDFEQSAKYYSISLSYDPRPREMPGGFWYDYARSLQGSGRPAEALAAYRRAQRLEKCPPAAGHGAGLMLAYLGATEAGIQEYLYVLARYPRLRENALPQWRLSLIKAQGSDFGVALFEALNENMTLSAGELGLWASFHINRKDFDLALELLDKAEKMNPEEPSVYLLRGEIYFLTRDFENMKKNYRRYLDLNPAAPQRAALLDRIRRN